LEYNIWKRSISVLRLRCNRDERRGQGKRSSSSSSSSSSSRCCKPSQHSHLPPRQLPSLQPIRAAVATHGCQRERHDRLHPPQAED
jgi:hypothetical protein